ncbi:MAG: 16S rRNA (guanine(527)-N(7))-methyltransferase RsmG [Chloroflexota bacterium]|nr:16S rRNA (guanine(527)-N(7))-methyltransferase RsmG [Chloroflexota bacterium]
MNERHASWEWLAGEFASLGDPEVWLPRLRAHAAMLAAAEVRTTAVPPEEMVRRHFAESLEILRIGLDASAAPPVVDVGSGGGFPGLVIAAVFPEWEVHLVEPIQKRARILATIAAGLGLTKVAVHPERAETLGHGPLREAAGLVTARAVAPLREVLEYTAPFATIGAPVILPKGSGFREELQAAERAMALLGVEYEGAVPMRPAISTTIVVARFRKVRPTPQRYPRRPGIPGKRPL